MSTSGGSTGGGSLTYDNGSLAAAVNITSTPATVLTTGSWAVGYWLADFDFSVSASATAGVQYFRLAAGTATYTALGVYACSLTTDNSNSNYYHAHITCLVHVTASGTMTINASSAQATGAALQPLNGVTGRTATGWTAIKIA